MYSIPILLSLGLGVLSIQKTIFTSSKVVDATPAKNDGCHASWSRITVSFSRPYKIRKGAFNTISFFIFLNQC
jgi:hypothetical protein